MSLVIVLFYVDDALIGEGQLLRTKIVSRLNPDVLPIYKAIVFAYIQATYFFANVSIIDPRSLCVSGR